MSDQASLPDERQTVRSRIRQRTSPSAAAPRKRARANKTTKKASKNEREPQGSKVGHLAEVARVLAENKVRSSEVTWFTERINVATLPQGAQEQWMNGPERLAFQEIDSGAKPLLATWRICAHLFRCSPVAIVSPQYGMYHVSGHGPSHDLVMWSQRFCQKLSMLVTHPFWNESRARLAFFIRFAAVYRNDRRHSLLSMPDILCPILCSLQRKTAAVAWDEDIHTLHIKLRNQAKQNGGILSQDSNVLYRLGEVISDMSRRKSANTTDDDQKVWVTGNDLDAVIEALDSYTSRSGLHVFLKTKTLYKIYIDAKEQNSFPSPEQLKTAHITSWLRQLRALHSSPSVKPNYTGLDTEPDRMPLAQDNAYQDDVEVRGGSDEGAIDSIDRQASLPIRNSSRSVSEQRSLEGDGYLTPVPPVPPRPEDSYLPSVTSTPLQQRIGRDSYIPPVPPVPPQRSLGRGSSLSQRQRLPDGVGSVPQLTSRRLPGFSYIPRFTGAGSRMTYTPGTTGTHGTGELHSTQTQSPSLPTGPDSEFGGAELNVQTSIEDDFEQYDESLHDQDRDASFDLGTDNGYLNENEDAADEQSSDQQGQYVKGWRRQQSSSLPPEQTTGQDANTIGHEDTLMPTSNVFRPSLDPDICELYRPAVGRKLSNSRKALGWCVIPSAGR